ncbi:MAG: hypothetical protein AB1714_21320 [Acidobacteriota bacterium]
MAPPVLMEQLREALPKLLKEHPEVRHELWGIMLEAFPSRQEFMAMLEEIRTMREESNRRFEAMREESNRRFEAVIQELQRHGKELERHGKELERHGRALRDLDLHMSSISRRVGKGLERVVQEVVEEFAGDAFPFAERVVLRDEAGELFGVPGAEVEFDLYAHNGSAYMVEVKSHVDAGDVLSFFQKVKFAERRLGRTLTPLIIALSMEPKASQLIRELGIRHRIRATLE